MRRSPASRRVPLALAPFAFALGLAAGPAHATVLFQETNLVSDGSVPALNPPDPDLKNPWGISFGPKTPFWVSDNGTGLATLYDGAGVKQGLVVTIPPPLGGPGPATPTGQVFNSFAGSGGFMLPNGKPAVFMFATEDGTISGWNGGTAAVLKVDNSAHGAVYKGLAIGGTGQLFAANFNSGRVEVFDSSFAPQSSFTDPTLPAGYAPFNVQVLDGKLYVTFALQDAKKHDDVAGAGHGFVDEFDLNGTLIRRVASRGTLNSPWGLAIAPASFGQFAGDLLVGNFGDGAINVFDPATGAFLGQLLNTGFEPIRLGDLWALTPGNGFAAGSPDNIYFTTGVAHEAGGLFGSLSAVTIPEPAPLGALLIGIGTLGLAARRRARPHSERSPT